MCAKTFNVYSISLEIPNAKLSFSFTDLKMFKIVKRKKTGNLPLNVRHPAIKKMSNNLKNILSLTKRTDNSYFLILHLNKNSTDLQKGSLTKKCQT